LLQSPTANISNALAGRLPGLTAIQTTGKPGEDETTLYIRGRGTYTGTTTPLIMVDGVARDTYNDIDPNEIETISILKDASATAVFGVRGANGVILITTKRGQSGTPKVSLSAQTGIVRFNDMPQYLGAYDWASLKNEEAYASYWNKHAKDAGLTWDTFIANRETDWRSEAAFQYSDEDLLYYQNARTPKLADGSTNPYYDPYFHPDTDWQDLIFKDFTTQSQYNVNIRGGSNAVKYFLSLGYLDQNGMFKDDYFPFPKEQQFSKKRYNIRGNFDFEVTKDFRISVDIGTHFETISGMNNDSHLYDQRLIWSNPVTNPGMIDGKFVVTVANPNPQNNILHQIADIDFDYKRNSTLNSAVKASHKLDFITKGLSVNARLAYDSFFSTNLSGWFSPQLYRATPNPNGDKLNPIIQKMYEDPTPTYGTPYLNGKWRKIYFEGSLNYSRKFGLHDVSALALYNVEKYYNPNLPYKLPHAYLGLVGRVTYVFNSKYLAEYNMGYNGSENFPEGKRFGFLPAYSLGWIVSNEELFPENDYVTHLKIRGSYGKVGNDNIIVNDVSQRYLYLPDTWSTGIAVEGYVFGNHDNRHRVPGAIEGVIGNPNVSWETATKSNIGFDMHLFKDKLSISYDYFNEDRVDILSFRGTVPALVQANLPVYNLGKVKNWGNEFEFTWRSKIREVNYWVKGNASTNKNKIVFRDEAIVPGLEYQAQTGRPIGQHLCLIDDGLYTSWSQLYNLDANGNPIFSEPVPALNSQGQPYSDADGNPVYQKDLGYGGAPIQPGEIRLRDVNEDGVVNDNDRMRTGKTAIPELTYGFSLGFDYKGFDFSVLFQGVSGIARFAVTNNNAMPFYNNYSLQEVAKYRFTQERYDAGERIELPVASYNHNIHTPSTSSYCSYFLKDASYIRLKNMEIGYTLTPSFLKKAGIQSARIYLNGNNLLTWSENSIWGDPENLGYTHYPLTQIYNLGLNINF
jgi:TonB-linked SusC/RagA family outer membrane protein